MTNKPLRGAGCCPKCGCTKTRQIVLPMRSELKFYAETLEACANPACRAIWEPIDKALIWDPDDKTSSFKSPCDNCAFRPASPEQRDTENWKELIGKLQAGGAFFCHKGVAINPQSEDGFDYPKRRDGTINVAKMRYCRGWLNMVRVTGQQKVGEVANG